MNRTLKEAIVRRYHYETHRQLREHLQVFTSFEEAKAQFSASWGSLEGLGGPWAKVYREPWQCDDVTYFQCDIRHTRVSPTDSRVAKTPKWALGCEARPKGLIDNRSVQDTP